MSTAATFLRWVGTLTLSFFIIFIVLPLLVIFTLSLFAGVMTPGVDKLANKQVAVIELEGMILDNKELLEQLYKQANDPNIHGIVLRINSPGGAIGPAQEIYAAVKKIKEKKPVIASMGGIAASGALYAALSATKIFCQPGTLTGSIGVIMQMPNVRKMTDFVGFEMTTIKSGALKDAGNLFREMTEGEKNYLQETVDTAFEQFLSAVVEGRKLDPELIRPFSDGRIILGSQAVKLGLVDDYGDLDTAARAVFEELKQPLTNEESPNLVYPMDELRWVRKFLNTSAYLSQMLEGRVQFNYLSPL